MMTSVQRESVLVFLVAGLLVQPSVSLSLDQTPSSWTTSTGSSILLTCNLNDSYDGYFEWRVFRGGDFGQQIYSTSGSNYHPDKRFPTDSYARHGVHGLNVTALGWQDGAVYLCEFLSAAIKSSASVIVIDELTTSFAIQSSSNTTTSSSSSPSSAQLVCSVSFGGPKFPNTNSSVNHQFPRLQMTLGSDLVFDSSVTQATYSPGSPGVAKHVLIATITRALSVVDHGKKLSCTVSTRNPGFTMSNHTTVSIPSLGIQNISIEPRLSFYMVGDVIACSAQGWPAPRVHWRPLSAPKSFNLRNIEGSNLTISRDMIGLNVWKCVTVSGENKATLNISFEVLGSTGIVDQNSLLMREEADQLVVGPTNEDNGGSNLGLAVGLAIGLLVLVALGILIALLLVKRRNRFTQDATGKPVAVSSIYSYTTVKSESSEFFPREGIPPQHLITGAPAVTPASGVIYQPRPASIHRSRPPSVLDRSGRGDLGLGIFRLDQNLDGADSLYPRDWPHGSSDPDGRPLMNEDDQVPPYVVRRSRTPSLGPDEMIQSPTGSLVAGGFADLGGRLDGTIGRLSRTSSLNRSRDHVTSFPPRRHSTVILEEDDADRMSGGIQYPVTVASGRPVTAVYRPAVAAKSAAVAEVGRALKRASANNSDQSSTLSNSMVNYSEMATVI